MATKKKKHNLRNGIILLLFLAVVGGLAFFAFRDKDEAIEVSMEEVTTGDITAVVTATGRVYPQVQVVISSEVPGEIIELPVRDGASVNRRDLLVSVNPDTLEAQVKQQEASLAGTRAASAERKARRLQAELDLDRIRELHQKGFATKEELDQAETSLEIAKASHQSALHEIERQVMQLQEARNQLGKASIFAPMGGTVISLNAEVGDRVVGTGQFEGTRIMAVADLAAMEVRVAVNEADVVDVEIGQTASIEIDALPDQSFSGKVTEIANSAETTDARSREEVTTFITTIQLDEPGQRLRPGMSATADIETATVTDVVKAPLGSVVVRQSDRSQKADSSDAPEDADSSDRSNEPPTVVFVANEGTAQRREVQTGIADRDFIEITSGLKAGETIITGSYRALTRQLEEGSPIRERDAANQKDWRDRTEN